MIAKNVEPLVNIIMPVYNAKEYIADAITSIVSQSYHNIRLIIIDDGSHDGSGSICDEFAAKDSRVEVHHQDNHGLCYARNQGLKKIGGGYVAFADHDDIYLPGSIETLVSIAETSNADLVKGTYIGEIINDDGSIRTYAAKMPSSVMSLEELANHYSIFNYAIRAMWNGMYKSDIIKEHSIKFDESLKAGAEDYNFNLAYLNFSVRIALTDYQLYKHYARENQSASVGYNENRQKGIVADYHTEADLLKGIQIKTETYVEHQLWYFYMLVREYCFKDTPLSQQEITKRLREFLLEMDNFKSVHIKDWMLLFWHKPKDMIKWTAMRICLPDLLFRHFKLKHG